MEKEREERDNPAFELTLSLVASSVETSGLGFPNRGGLIRTYMT